MKKEHRRFSKNGKETEGARSSRWGRRGGKSGEGDGATGGERKLSGENALGENEGEREKWGERRAGSEEEQDWGREGTRNQIVGGMHPGELREHPKGKNWGKRRRQNIVGNGMT